MFESLKLCVCLLILEINRTVVNLSWSARISVSEQAPRALHSLEASISLEGGKFLGWEFRDHGVPAEGVGVDSGLNFATLDRVKGLGIVGSWAGSTAQPLTSFSEDSFNLWNLFVEIILRRYFWGGRLWVCYCRLNLFFNITEESCWVEGLSVLIVKLLSWCRFFSFEHFSNFVNSDSTMTLIISGSNISTASLHLIFANNKNIVPLIGLILCNLFADRTWATV